MLNTIMPTRCIACDVYTSVTRGNRRDGNSTVRKRERYGNGTVRERYGIRYGNCTAYGTGTGTVR